MSGLRRIAAVQSLDGKKAAWTGGSLLGGLVLYMLSTMNSNREAAVREHGEVMLALANIRERLARQESRMDFHHGQVSAQEAAIANMAANAEKLTEPKQPQP